MIDTDIKLISRHLNEDLYEKSNKALNEDEELINKNHPQTRKCIFKCIKCNRCFQYRQSLIHHIFYKRVPCDRIVNSEMLIKKKLLKISEEYDALNGLSQDTLINFEYKKKHLRRVYTNAEKMLEFLNRKYLSCNSKGLPTVAPSSSPHDNGRMGAEAYILEEELLSKLITDLEIIMNNCKTGNFIND